MPSVFDRLNELLTRSGVPFTISHHEPVFTSEEAAAIRGVPLSSGAKALVVKVGDAFRMLIVPADRKLDSKKTRESLAVKSTRFATRDEVEQITTLQPGSIPPFGSLFGLQTIVDPALGLNESINFNAGDHAISIQLRYEDYVQVERPQFAVLTDV
jgi:Ala-tRNA(Pro) deacylase